MNYSQQVLQALQDGDMAAEKQLFAKALRHDDDDTLYSLAEELYALGFLRQARRIYLKLLDKYPDEDELRTVLADIAVSDGHTDEALTYLDAIQPDSPAYGQALMTAADVYQTMGMPEVSEAKLKAAQELYPDEPAIWFGLGELYFSLGRYQEATIAYEQLLHDDIETFAGVMLYQRLGASLAGSGDYEAAISALTKLPEETLDKDTRFQLGFLYLQVKDYAKAIHLLSDLESADPDYTSLYPYLAEAQEKNGDLKGAYLTTQTGIAHDQYNEVLYQHAYDLATKLGDETAAEEYLKELLTINPDNQSAVLALSNLLIKQGRFEDNLALLDDHQPTENDPQMLWNKARSLQHMENYAEAKETYLLAYNQLKSDPEFLRDLITFFQEEGMVKEAILALQNYVKLVPDDFERQELLDELLDEQNF
ncbi:tetratricopeptide repeat protein [Agrilactobacillus fermenti]|uniref:tetratricopeptide repeat protein n=1 Tax=Agrilactobacillus fermenti TaxID=2586909 RepID=UPI003A5C4B87